MTESLDQLKSKWEYHPESLASELGLTVESVRVYRPKCLADQGFQAHAYSNGTTTVFVYGDTLRPVQNMSSDVYQAKFSGRIEVQCDPTSFYVKGTPSVERTLDQTGYDLYLVEVRAFVRAALVAAFSGAGRPQGAPPAHSLWRVGACHV